MDFSSEIQHHDVNTSDNLYLEQNSTQIKRSQHYAHIYHHHNFHHQHNRHQYIGQHYNEFQNEKSSELKHFQAYKSSGQKENQLCPHQTELNQQKRFQLAFNASKNHPFIKKLEQHIIDIPQFIPPTISQQPIHNSGSSIESYTVSKTVPNISGPSIHHYSQSFSQEIQSQQSQNIQSVLESVNNMSIIKNKQNQEHQQVYNIYDSQWAIPLKHLDIKNIPSTHNKACSSYISFTKPSKFQYFLINPLTYLFTLNLFDKQFKIYKIGRKLLSDIKKINNFLLNEIQIGDHLNFNKLVVLFKIEFESFQILKLARNWSQGSYQEHGIEFIDSKNLSNLKKIILIGDYLSTKMIQSFRYADELIRLKVLELRFEKQVPDEKLEMLLQHIEIYSPEIKIRVYGQKREKEGMKMSEEHKKKIKFISIPIQQSGNNL